MDFAFDSIGTFTFSIYQVETIDGLRILLRGSRSRSNESGSAVATTSQNGQGLSSENSIEGDVKKVEEPNKESSHSSTSGSQGDKEGDNTRKVEIGTGKRPRTGERVLP